MVSDRIYRFQPALPRSQDTIELIREVTTKSEGVFLWVTIVLAMLEQGVINGNYIAELRAKIRVFPADLDDLYQHLFDGTNQVDRKIAFQALAFLSLLQHMYSWASRVFPRFENTDTVGRVLA
jgi:hypothetical protein